jgi:hypothetical protein
MKVDNLSALFITRLQILSPDIDHEKAMRALMARFVRLKEEDARLELLDGRTADYLLPNDDPGYFAIVNAWRHVPEILEIAKKNGVIHADYEIGKYPMEDVSYADDIRERGYSTDYNMTKGSTVGADLDSRPEEERKADFLARASATLAEVKAKGFII